MASYFLTLYDRLHDNSMSAYELVEVVKIHFLREYKYRCDRTIYISDELISHKIKSIFRSSKKYIESICTHQVVEPLL
jgi:hypothetical protein